MIIVASLFSKSSVFKMFSVHTKMISRGFSNSSSPKSVFEKLRFRDGLVWTVGLSVGKKNVFKFLPGSVDVVWKTLRYF